MRFLILITFCYLSLTVLSQNYSEADIKKLAVQFDRQIKGTNMGNGVTAKGCLSTGRKIIYQYEVPQNWVPSQNMKEEIISNLRATGAAKSFFLHNLDADFHFYKGRSIAKIVSVKSNEFSIHNLASGEYLSIKDHPKAKGVNLKLKVPVGWQVKEGNRPNIVKKITNEGNSYIIMIRDNVTFFSRKQIIEELQKDNTLEESVHEMTAFLGDPQVIEQSIVTIDTYPTLQFIAKGTMERSGLTFPVIMKCWMIFYEDKIIFLQGMAIDNSDFKDLIMLYSLMTNSVVLPEQYN